MANDSDRIDEPLSHADLLLEIVRALVNDVPSAKVTEQMSQDGEMLQLVVSVAPDDRGKVIGKGGATMVLLRQLFTKIGAADSRLRIHIDLDQLEEQPARRHRLRQTG